MSAHTPGPWTHSSAGVNYHTESDSRVHTFGIHGPTSTMNGNGWLADVYSGRVGSDGIDKDEAEANARLIAEAPAMLEIVKAVAAMVIPGSKLDTEARALIAKIEGAA